MELFSMVLLLLSIIITYGEINKPTQKKVRSLFNRHYDCLVTYLHNGHVIDSPVYDKHKYLNNVTVQIKAFGRHFTVDLTLNKQLFSDSYIENVLSAGGQTSKKNHKEIEHCFYHGQLRFQRESDAALSICGGVRGYFTDKYDTYHIEPLSGRIHRVYRDRDARPLNLHCGTEPKDARFQTHKMIISRHKRQVHRPYDSNRNTRYVELYLVNDYRTYERHGKDSRLIIKRSQDIANIVSSLYRQLNIYIALVGVEVWSSGDLISITPNAESTMTNFLHYRKERINPKHPNDNAQLITGVFFDDGVIGKAINGPICTHRFSGGVNMDYGGLVTQVATTVAHEMGHNFGMEHDNGTKCDCRDDKCIMASTSGKISPSKWSSCSKTALAEAFDLGMDYCLKNVPKNLYNGPVCGNGFKEDGEECDCGLAKDCTNRCCNATSCKLAPGAQCATGRCCDLNICKPKEASTLCREPVGECDAPEFCNGTSEYCQHDVFYQDGIQCKGGQSYCYHGQCKTHTDQCKLLWGDTGYGSDPICYQQLNIVGDKDGSCGYNWTTDNPDKYTRCQKEDVMCGKLHCVHLNEKLMFWRDNLGTDMRATFLSRGNEKYICRSAMLDVGLDMPDPGFVPDGAKCEDKKICINHKCVPLAKLKVKQCSGNCNGHGKCNNQGNCHCDIGYEPPDCAKPGYGGSVDSGPASDEYGNNNTLLIVLLVVFLLVIPLIILAVLAYLNRRRVADWSKKLPNFKCRMGSKKPPPWPPQPNPSAGYTRAEHEAPTANVITNPMIQHNVDTSKIWIDPSKKLNKSAKVPPERPAAPSRPLIKKNKSKSQSKQVRLSIPIQETEAPSPTATKVQTSPTVKSELNKSSIQSVKSNGVVKRESFRGSKISDPVLVCTTNRNSLVLAEGHVDIIGPEARRSPPTNRPSAVTVKRSQSELSSKGPSSITSQEHTGWPRSPSVQITQNRHSNFISQPVSESFCDADTQPLYSNEPDSLLDMIDQELTNGVIYCNVPVQETAAPGIPPRDPVTQHSQTSVVTNTQPMIIPSQLKTARGNMKSSKPIHSIASKNEKPSPTGDVRPLLSKTAISTKPKPTISSAKPKPVLNNIKLEKPSTVNPKTTNAERPKKAATRTQSEPLDTQETKLNVSSIAAKFNQSNNIAMKGPTQPIHLRNRSPDGSVSQTSHDVNPESSITHRPTVPPKPIHQEDGASTRKPSIKRVQSFKL